MQNHWELWVRHVNFFAFARVVGRDDVETWIARDAVLALGLRHRVGEWIQSDAMVRRCVASLSGVPVLTLAREQVVVVGVVCTIPVGPTWVASVGWVTCVFTTVAIWPYLVLALEPTNHTRVITVAIKEVTGCVCSGALCANAT